MVEILVLIAIIGFVVVTQLRGTFLTARRLILAPAGVALLGVVELSGSSQPATAVSIGLIAAAAVAAAAIGVWQGLAMRLEARDGVLWGQLPASGVRLWGLLVLVRVVLYLVACADGAGLADSLAALLMTLAVNRLAQATVIGVRAFAAGIPFAPEQRRSTLSSQAFGWR